MKYKLYHGQSPYLSLKSVHLFLDNSGDNSSSELLVIDAENTDIQIIIDTLSSPTLFSIKRTILLKRIYRNKNKENGLQDILAILENSNSLDTIIFWEDQKIKANTKYYKFFNNNKAIEESKALDKRTFFTWLRNQLEKENLTIQNNASRLLAERTNYDPERCSNELKKLKLVVEDNNISRKDVENLISDTLENDIWHLIDSINKKDTVGSSKILEKLITQAVDSNYIISMITRNLRLITLTKYLLEESDSTGNISKTLKVPPFTVPSLVNASKEYSNKKIKMLYTKLSNLDYKIKKGLINPTLGITLISTIL